MGEQGTRKSSKLAAALAAIHEGIRKNLELDEIAGLTAKYLSDLIVCPRCSVFLIGEGNINIMAEMGEREDIREAELKVEPLTEYFLNHPETIFSGDFATHPAFGFIDDNHKFHSVICAPVRTDNGAAGFILLGSHQKSAFDPDDRQLVELLAEELAIALKISLLQGKIRDLTVLDELTGCFKREQFNEDIEVEIPCAERYGRPLSILLIAVDGIRNHGDSAGPSQGDTVLKQIADILTYSIRQCDKLYRYGGEEFVIMLPGIDRERAEFAAKRLIKVIRQKTSGEQPTDQHAPEPAINIGIANFPGDAVYRDGLIRFLEADLSRARQSAA